MPKRWYNLTPEQIGEQLNTDIRFGLTSEAAEFKLHQNGENNSFLMPDVSFASYLRAISRDITVYLMVATAIMSAIFSQDVSAVVIIILLLINLSLSLFFYSKSRKTLRDMARVAAPMSRVIRNGRMYSISQRKIVEGDIVVLGAGDIVPADARVIQSSGLSVVETNITGEKGSVEKNERILYGLNVPISSQSDMVFATTVVTGGWGVVVVCAVGDETYVSEIGKRPEIVAHDKLNVLTTLKKCCKGWALAMLVMILVLTSLDLILGLRSRSLFDVYITGLSLAVAAMSEMYVVFGYYIIGSGLDGPLKHIGGINAGAAIKNVESLEDLKKITTLIVPRKGGFFSNITSIERLWYSDTFHRPNEKHLFKYCGRLLKYAMLSSGYQYYNRMIVNDPASDTSAILRTAESIGLDRNVIASEYPCLDYTQITVEDQPCDLSLVASDGEMIALARGDALRMLGKSATFIDDGKVKKLSERDRKHITEAIKRCRNEGYKAVGVISRLSETFLAGSVDDEDTEWNFEGFIVFLEPMLRGAFSTVERCKEAGIRVIMLSEESSEQNRIYAQRLGIISDISDNSQEVLSSKEMSCISDESFRLNLEKYRLCEELSFVQKKLLIRYLQENGEKVGFLGRELDDIKLIKDADIGFTSAVTLASGSSSLDLGSNDSPIYIQEKASEFPGGCEALKYACDVIVSPPDGSLGGFNSMVSAIASSKLIYQNLMRMVKYLIMSQTARFFIVLYSVFANSIGIYKRDAIQLFTSPELLFSGLIVDFTVIVAIAYQRRYQSVLTEKENTEERLGKGIIKNFKLIVFGFLFAALVIFAPMMLSLFGIHVKGAHITSMVFVSFILTQLILACEIINENSLFDKRSRINKVVAILAIMIIVFILVMTLFTKFGALFDYVSLNKFEWLAVFAVVSVSTLSYEVYKLIKRRYR